jgi:hypothetical protein
MKDKTEENAAKDKFCNELIEIADNLKKILLDRIYGRSGHMECHCIFCIRSREKVFPTVFDIAFPDKSKNNSIFIHQITKWEYWSVLLKTNHETKPCTYQLDMLYWFSRSELNKLFKKYFKNINGA